MLTHNKKPNSTDQLASLILTEKAEEIVSYRKFHSSSLISLFCSNIVRVNILN